MDKIYYNKKIINEYIIKNMSFFGASYIDKIYGAVVAYFPYTQKILGSIPSNSTILITIKSFNH
jgi:hypothetical protein